MTSRPAVSVYDPATLNTTDKKIGLPAVFTAPIRLDIVQFVHANINKNRRQAHGVNVKAGMKHSAESWGTGRAVARIPRVGGSGTHRSGQAAFGNMCRKGRMFAPLKTWRRWHRRVNIKQKRHAVASALAASAIVPLVLARGHRIQNVPQLPLVFDDKLESYEKTRQAVDLLKRAGAYDDVKKVIETRRIKAGKGKLRNRRYHARKGPLFIYSNENVKLVQAVRNIPGVEIANVNRLNLLQLAPGGHIGRFIIWTASAFQSLDKIFGTYRYGAQEKQDYHLNRPVLANADLARVINSNEVQSVVRAAKQSRPMHSQQRKNALKNKALMEKLNPAYKSQVQASQKQEQESRKKRQEALQAKRSVLSAQQKKDLKAHKKLSDKWISMFNKDIANANQAGVEEEQRLKEVYEIKDM